VAQCIEAPYVGLPAAWEVVVAIEAFPINAADLAVLAGRYGALPQLPSSVGMEAVGKVVRCGEAVRNVVAGDRVVLLANNNWSEYRKVPATTVHKVPSDIDPLQLCMLKVNPATAHLMLQSTGELVRGDWIVQSAPLGSVGRCVLQMTRSKGIKTVNIVRDLSERKAILDLGGDVVVEVGPDMAKKALQATGGRAARLALDAVAGGGTQAIADCLAEGGRIVTYGMLSGEPCTLTPEQAIFRGIKLEGFWLSKVLNRLNLGDRTSLYDSICEQIRKGLLNIAIDSVYSINSFNDAIRRAEQRGRSGKVVVTFDSNFEPGTAQLQGERFECK
jgi:NADPH:quinone reductase-like Zn-dependent oxidoreductase